MGPRRCRPAPGAVPARAERVSGRPGAFDRAGLEPRGGGAPAGRLRFRLLPGLPDSRRPHRLRQAHTTFNRNRGDWVSTETFSAGPRRSIQTVHCHNDGDYYDDGLFWRDGSYPPYPDMDRYDKVLTDCRRVPASDRRPIFEQGLHPEHQGVPGTWAGVGAEGPQGEPAAQFLPPAARVRRADVPAVRLAGVLEAFHRPRAEEPPARRRLLRLERRPVLLQSASRGGRGPGGGQGALGHRRAARPDGVDAAARRAGRAGDHSQHDDPDVRHREFRRLRGGDRMGLREMGGPGPGPRRPAAGMAAGGRSRGA